MTRSLPGQLVESVVKAAPQLLGQVAGTTRRLPLACDYDRIYLHHIRKTGGTSISVALMSLGGEDPVEVERRVARVRPHVTRTGDLVVAAHDRLALMSGGYSYGWSHMPAWKIRLPSRTFTVTVLRDPVARVVSLYRYLRDPTSDEGHAFAAPASDRAMAADGFDAFLDRVPTADLLNQLFMFSPNFDPAEAADAVAGCSLVFWLRDMDYGLGVLSDLLGIRLETDAQRSSLHPFRPTETQLERLRHLLRPEYELVSRLSPLLEDGPYTPRGDLMASAS